MRIEPGAEKQLRVLMWCPFISPGGGAHFLGSLVSALAKHPKLDLVRLVLPAPIKDWERFSLPDTYKLDIIHLRSFQNIRRIWGIKGTGRLYSLWHHGRFSMNTDNLNNTILAELALDCDVVYVFWPHRMSFPRVKRPIVCTIQDVTLLDFPEILGWQMTEIERENLREWLTEAAQVIVGSEATKQALTHHFPEEKASINVIRHAILPYHDIKATKQICVEGVPEKYIVYSSSLLPHKNLDLLLVAFSRFALKAELPLVITGVGTELFSGRPARKTTLREDALIGLTQRLGLRSKIDVFGLGYISDGKMGGLIQNAAALISPTLSEGGGSYPIEEALAAGVPVLCSDLPVLREQLEGRTAKIAWFDPLSVDSMLDILQELFNNYNEYKSAALESMNDPRPGWTNIADAYVTAFKAAAQNHSGKVSTKQS